MDYLTINVSPLKAAGQQAVCCAPRHRTWKKEVLGDFLADASFSNCLHKIKDIFSVEKCWVLGFFPHCFMQLSFIQNHVSICKYKNQGNEKVPLKTQSVFVTLKDTELYDWTDEAHLGCRAKEDRFQTRR